MLYFSISIARLKGLIAHLKTNGMTAKEKKSGGRKSNTNCYTFNDIERTVKFIQQYAVLHGLLLPGKTPGVRKDGVILMPSSETKVKIFEAYKSACTQDGMYYNNIYMHHDNIR